MGKLILVSFYVGEIKIYFQFMVTQVLLTSDRKLKKIDGIRIIITLQFFIILKNGFLYSKEHKNNFLNWKPHICIFSRCWNKDILSIHGHTKAFDVSYKIDWIRIIITFRISIISKNGFLYRIALKTGLIRTKPHICMHSCC